MRALAASLAFLLLVACAGVEMKPGTKSHARREVPPGPGILTGTQGEFVLFRLNEETVSDAEAVDDKADHEE